MASPMEEFNTWLASKLKVLKTDEIVFGSYITGILDGDETSEEKREAIEGILVEIMENGTNALCQEIIDKWAKAHPVEPDVERAEPAEDVDTKLVRLLESQSLSTATPREYTDEERKIREAILAQYSQMTDEEDETDEGGTGDFRENGLERNTNALAVQQAEKEKREQARIESQKKKDKDKEDREKQKQLKEEKKEKRKTQKGERRR